MSTACDTCAFRPGSVTHDTEPYNALRGIICALGARPFHCHHINGEDHHADEQYLIQRMPQIRRFLRQVSEQEPAFQGLKVLEGETTRLCEGWKAAVAENKAKGLFDDPKVREVRRLVADRALVVIEDFIAAEEGSELKSELNYELGSLIGMLAEPAEAK